jgi:GNAT superfamily N-acetyltransferase
MAGVLVRRATASDLDTIVALRLALLREYPDHPIYGRLRPDAERRARPVFATQLDSDSEAMFLAERDHAAIGLIRCVESVASPLLIPDRYCYVSSVYVRPEYRRQGVLRELFEHARAWCRARGLTEMRLHNVGRAATSAAWDALGFEVVEQVRVLHLDAKETDAVVGTADFAHGSSSATTIQP